MERLPAVAADGSRPALVLCGIVLVAACQSASPTAPTEPEPEPVTLSGT